MDGISDGLSISGSGLTADRLWMDVVASNLANMNTAVTPQGGPYRREEVIFAPSGALSTSFGATLQAALAGGAPAAPGVEVAAVVQDPSPPRLVYDPQSPLANAQGYVAMPNVNEVTEMSDLAAAAASYDANATALGVEEQTVQRVLGVGQGA
jgi:flagellar basal-body rod protein FlgC